MWKIFGHLPSPAVVYTSHLFEKQQVIVPRSGVFAWSIYYIYVIIYRIWSSLDFGDLFDEYRVSHFMAYLELYATKPWLSIESSHVWARWGTQHHGGMWLCNMMYRSSPFISHRIWIKPWYLPQKITLFWERLNHPYYYPSYLQVIKFLNLAIAEVQSIQAARHSAMWGTSHQPKWEYETNVTEQEWTETRIKYSSEI